jgi:hypothetical protein
VSWAGFPELVSSPSALGSVARSANRPQVLLKLRQRRIVGSSASSVAVLGLSMIQQHWVPAGSQMRLKVYRYSDSASVSGMSVSGSNSLGCVVTTGPVPR